MHTRFIILICLCTLFIKATCKSSDPPSTSEQIHLHGTLDFSISQDNVEAFVDENAVYVCFRRSFGYVTVSIYNPTGLTIYCSVVNTTVQQQLIIPISLNNEGIYTLVLENATGYADGDFEKQHH